MLWVLRKPSQIKKDGSFEHPKHMLLISEPGPSENGCGVTLLSFTIISGPIIIREAYKYSRGIPKWPCLQNSVARSPGCHPTFITQYKMVCVTNADIRVYSQPCLKALLNLFLKKERSLNP